MWMSRKPILTVQTVSKTARIPTLPRHTQHTTRVYPDVGWKMEFPCRRRFGWFGFYIATWVSSARYTGWLASWLVSGHWEKVCDSISFFCGWLPPGMNRDSPKRRREVRWMISSKRSAPRCFHKSSWNSRATLSISLSLAVCSFLGLVGYLIYSCI